MEKVKYMCSECKMYKNANEFFHVAYNKHRKGVSYMCKECKRKVRNDEIKSNIKKYKLKVLSIYLL